jgi:hypothetical protein
MSDTPNYHCRPDSDFNKPIIPQPEPKTPTPRTEIVDGIAIEIGRLAARWAHGELNLASFAEAVDTKLNDARQLERELAGWKEGHATLEQTCKLLGHDVANLREEIAEANKTIIIQHRLMSNAEQRGITKGREETKAERDALQRWVQELEALLLARETDNVLGDWQAVAKRAQSALAAARADSKRLLRAVDLLLATRNVPMSEGALYAESESRSAIDAARKFTDREADL